MIYISDHGSHRLWVVKMSPWKMLEFFFLEVQAFSFIPACSIVFLGQATALSLHCAHPRAHCTPYQYLVPVALALNSNNSPSILSKTMRLVGFVFLLQLREGVEWGHTRESHYVKVSGMTWTKWPLSGFNEDFRPVFAKRWASEAYSKSRNRGAFRQNFAWPFVDMCKWK